MANPYFQFKQFIIQQDRCTMKVTTDACLFGAWVADKIKNEKSKIENCLDIGAGTGLLSLILAQKNSSSSIDAIEIDEVSFQQAKENIFTSPFAERINIFNGDVKTFALKKRYDLFISNPPFYESDLKSTDRKKNIAHHNEGLLLPELLAIIKANLQPNGIFYLLLPYKRNKEIKELLLQYEFSVSQIILVRQSIKHDYLRMMISGKLKGEEPVETIINEISIWNAEEQYTLQFTELLKDYYLYL